MNSTASRFHISNNGCKPSPSCWPMLKQEREGHNGREHLADWLYGEQMNLWLLASASMADDRGRWSGLLWTSFTKIMFLTQAASLTSLLCVSATPLRTSSFYTPCFLPMRPCLWHHVEAGPGLHLLLLWVHMNERTPFDKLPDNYFCPGFSCKLNVAIVLLISILSNATRGYKIQLWMLNNYREEFGVIGISDFLGEKFGYQKNDVID